MPPFDSANIAFDIGKHAAGNAIKALKETIDTAEERHRMAATVMAMGTLLYLVEGLCAWHEQHKPDALKNENIKKSIEDVRDVWIDDDPKFEKKIAGFYESKATKSLLDM
jgi:hypothetical protein